MELTINSLSCVEPYTGHITPKGVLCTRYFALGYELVYKLVLLGGSYSYKFNRFHDPDQILQFIQSQQTKDAASQKF